MKTSIQNFGTIETNDVQLVTLSNDNGLEVKISNYGATITSVRIPDKDGKIDEIVCGFDNLSSYFSSTYNANAPYFGGTVGRYCSQIKDSKFSLKGVDYQLNKIVGDNNLHGGKVGFDKKLWSIEKFDKDLASVAMKFKSEHLEEGFPGNVDILVTFTVTDSNELKIDYKATTDQSTPFTITNHSYFNLTGFKDDVLSHTIKIASDKKQVWDETGAATGTNVSVAGKPDDLRKPKVIGDVHNAMKDGFEHYYLFEEKGFELDKVAEIKEDTSGRSLQVYTTEPGMLFYTGKYTSDELKRESGLQFGKYRGLCLETHRYPNGPNIANAPKSILEKGETYQSTTIFKFDW
ncbi:MAG: aldose epimerase family protein [Maribacter sp.]